MNIEFEIERYGLVITVTNMNGYKSVTISGRHPEETNTYCQHVKRIPDNEWNEAAFRMWAAGIFSIIRRADFDR